MLSFLRPEKQYRNDTQQRDDKGDKEIVVNGTDVSLQIDTLQYQHLRHFLGCIGRSAPCMFYKPAQGMKGLPVYVSCIVECFAISLRVKSRTLCQQMTEDGYSETSSHLPDNVRDTGSLCHITVTDIHQRQGQQRGEEQSHTQSAQIKTQHDVPLLGQKR